MTTTTDATVTTTAAPRTASPFAHITPNWFASVMGTGIVANAAATLPFQDGLLHGFAIGVWALGATMLIVLTAAFATHWRRHQSAARGYAVDPVMGQFYGAPAMALLTVGAGTQLVGVDVVGERPALIAFTVLWVAGTAIGLVTALWLPFAMITAHDHETAVPLPAWLMPVVPPMVSASTGALLLPHAAAGQLRLSLFVACYALFGLSLLIGLITMALVYGRLVLGGPPAVQAAPTTWITLGLLGQSITAANLLGHDAPLVLDRTAAEGLHVFGLLYGMVMGGFGALVFALATALTVHAARRGLAFSLTWWSFTFPIGTCVTGASALSVALDSDLVRDLAVLLYLVLLAAWATVATHTARGLRSGRLLQPA